MSKRLMSVIVLVLLTASGSVQSASYFRSAASFLGRLFYWGGTLGVPASVGISLSAKKLADDFCTEQGEFVDGERSRYPLTGALIQEELKKLGATDMRVVPFVGSFALINNIGISASFLEKVEKSLQTGNSKSLEGKNTIEEFKGLLHSKVHQLKNNDNKTELATAAAAACVPVIARPAVRALFGITKAAPTTWVNARMAIQGQVNRLVAGSIFVPASRLMERDNDEASSDAEAIVGIRRYRQKEKDAFYAALKDYPKLAYLAEKTYPSANVMNGVTGWVNMCNELKSVYANRVINNENASSSDSKK